MHYLSVPLLHTRTHARANIQTVVNHLKTCALIYLAPAHAPTPTYIKIKFCLFILQCLSLGNYDVINYLILTRCIIYQSLSYTSKHKHTNNRKPFKGRCTHISHTALKISDFYSMQCNICIEYVSL